MSTNPTIVAFCGSQADDSKTRQALKRALQAAEANGATTELIDLRTIDLPTFDTDYCSQLPVIADPVSGDDR